MYSMHNYRTAGFVYKILIGVNYVSCRELANFNSAGTLALSFQLTACVTVSCLWFLYPMSLFKYFKEYRYFCFAAGPTKLKDRNGWVNHVHWQRHFATLVDMLSSDHRVYRNNDSSNSTSHPIARDNFTRSCKLVIGYFADITAVQRN